MTTSITRPTAPEQPITLRWLIEDHNTAVRTMNKAVRHGASVTGLFEEINTHRALIKKWYATDEGQAYRAAVEAYNTAATAWNNHIKTERQARRNTREVTKVRSAACPRCFATHPGEC